MNGLIATAGGSGFATLNYFARPFFASTIIPDRCFCSLVVLVRGRGFYERAGAPRGTLPEGGDLRGLQVRLIPLKPGIQPWSDRNDSPEESRLRPSTLAVHPPRYRRFCYGQKLS